MRKKAAVIIVTVMSVLAMVFCFSACNGSEEASAPFKITDVTTSKEYSKTLGWAVTISGTAENVGKKDYSYVSLYFALYDENSYLIGTVNASTGATFSRGMKWSFKTITMYFDREPMKYKFDRYYAW